MHFIKSKPGHIEIDEGGRPVVCGEDTISREIYARPYDLVVLATGMEPSGGEFTPDIALEEDDYGFLVARLGDHEGIFSCGVASGPLDVAMSVQSATAAALKAINAVRKIGEAAA